VPTPGLHVLAAKSLCDKSTDPLAETFPSRVRYIPKQRIFAGSLTPSSDTRLSLDVLYKLFFARGCMNNNGESLLEILIGVAFLSVILGSSILVLSKWHRGPPIEKISRELLAYIDSAHHRSLVQSCDLALSFEESQHRFRNSGEYCPEQDPFFIPDTVRAELRFGGRNSAQMFLYENGTATPGRITLRSTENEKVCEIIQGLRGGRRLICSK